MDIILNHPDGSSHDITVASFDYLTDTEITVKGLDVNALYKYCFSVYPYYVDNGVVIPVEEGSTESCEFTTIDAPTGDDFDGFSTSGLLPGDIINLTWQAPLKGVYNSFKVYLRTDGNPFVLSDALSYITNNPGQTLYIEKEVSYNDRSISFAGLGSGTFFVGIWTYYKEENLYSTNDALKQVIIP